MSTQSVPRPDVNYTLHTVYEVMQLTKAEHREKTRDRMARSAFIRILDPRLAHVILVRYRQQLKQRPSEEQEAAKERARQARARWREKEQARITRAENFVAKHGKEVHQAKLEKRRLRQQAKAQKQAQYEAKGEQSVPTPSYRKHSVDRDE
ncbi:hypothetical protein B0H19DRAFT_1229828 [Mycena capillaripes]|nr:hypothetical protein B0H19DRAFT_1229828 [Mycena capillaripes]